MVQDTTMLKVDRKSDNLLEFLAKEENRTKIDEFRFLLKDRLKTLGLKQKGKSNHGQCVKPRRI